MKPNRLTRLALLTAVALIMFVVEQQLPPLAPIPGIKLGLANVVTLFALCALGPLPTGGILLARCFLGSLFAGSLSGLIFSSDLFTTEPFTVTSPFLQSSLTSFLESSGS